MSDPVLMEDVKENFKLNKADIQVYVVGLGGIGSLLGGLGSPAQGGGLGSIF